MTPGPTSNIDRVVAAMQIVGASATAAAALGVLFGTGSSIASLLIYAAMLVFCGATVLAGIWLWNAELRGYRLAAISLAFQIPVIQSTIFSYKFSFGLGTTLYVAGAPGRLHWDLGGFGQLMLFGGQVPFLAGLNIVAIAALVWVLRQQHQLEKHADGASSAGELIVPAVTDSRGPANNGALIYAANIDAMARFYAQCFDMTTLLKAPDKQVLASDELQLVIQEHPPGTPVDPEPGEQQPSAIKLFFRVENIDDSKRIIEEHGGRVLPQRYAGPLFDVVNVLDPEGNMQHVREFHTAPAPA